MLWEIDQAMNYFLCFDWSKMNVLMSEIEDKTLRIVYPIANWKTNKESLI